MLDRGNFHDAMRPLLALFRAPATPEEVKQHTDYLESVYSNVSNMDGYLFSKVTKELSANIGPRSGKPFPSQFRAIYDRLKGEQPKAQFTCTSCGTIGWVNVLMMDQKTAEFDTFARPCPDCRANHPLKNAPQRLGWVEAEVSPKSEPDEKTRIFIDALLGTKSETPKAALEEITKRWHSGDFKLDRLTDFITRSKPQIHNEERHKNELVRAMLETPIKNAPARETSADSPPVSVVEEGSPARSPSDVFEDGSRMDVDGEGNPYPF